MQGVAGFVAQRQTPHLISDFKSSSIFDKSIDIESLMPIYCFPILEEDPVPESASDHDINEIRNRRTLAVIEFVLKQRIQFKDEKEMMIQEAVDLGLNQSAQSLATTFGKFIKAAIGFVRSKISKKG